jgi:hypothetical protein
VGDQDLLSRAFPCFGKHVKLLLQLQFQGELTSGRWPVVKIIVNLSQHDEKHVVPTPLSVIRAGKRKELCSWNRSRVDFQSYTTIYLDYLYTYRLIKIGLVV